jgi:SCF-associated factor 1
VTNYTGGARPDVQELPINREELGIISDLQMGGWSMYLLTDGGKLYCLGRVDGDNMQQNSGSAGVLKELIFPPSVTSLEKKLIHHFSAGRKAVLGLADDLTIWLWYSKDELPKEIKFPSLVDGDSKLKTTRVVAGWARCSAYIRGHGIVVWPLTRWKTLEEDSWEPPFCIVDKSSYLRPPPKKKSTSLFERITTVSLDEENPEVGEVTSHVLLESHIVFTTHAGKVFACKNPEFSADATGEIQSHPAFEISDLSGAAEVQGSFRSFGIFKKSGEVVVVHESFLLAAANRNEDPPLPPLIPALQNTGVIQLAFADYHYMALHSCGKITAYGVDPGRSGALGIRDPRGAFNFGIDRRLLPHAYIRGRQIWFHPCQMQFESKQDTILLPLGIYHNTVRLGEWSEWMEQQGTDWEKWPEVASFDTDHLGPYYGLSIAAGGWSSAALVLVNQKLVDKIAEAYQGRKDFFEKKVNFPFDDGHELDPRLGPPAEWKKPPPVWPFERSHDRTDVFGVEGFRFKETPRPSANTPPPLSPDRLSRSV